MKKIIKHYPMTGRIIVTQGYNVLLLYESDMRVSTSFHLTLLIFVENHLRNIPVKISSENVQVWFGLWCKVP
jgi:hypothetical protein